jgi:hypothetical protein
MIMPEEKRNQDGDIPSDKPGKNLVNPPKPHKKSRARSSNKNTTAKDPNLGSRNAVR